jgi:hypothetical protein
MSHKLSRFHPDGLNLTERMRGVHFILPESLVGIESNGTGTNPSTFAE